VTDEEFDSILAGCLKMLKNQVSLFKDQMKANNSPVFEPRFMMFLINDCLFK